MKKCSKCGLEKQESEFNRDSSKGDGLYSSCRPCCDAYYASVRERKLSYKKEYRAKNAQKIAEYRRQYYESNSDRAKEVAKTWAKNNRIKKRIAESCRRAAKRGSEGKHKKDDVLELLSLQKGKCACCKTKVDKLFHVDHVIPLSKGGDNGRSNLQILCPTCNMQKKDKHPVKFMQEKGFLL